MEASKQTLLILMSTLLVISGNLLYCCQGYLRKPQLLHCCQGELMKLQLLHCCQGELMKPQLLHCCQGELRELHMFQHQFVRGAMSIVIAVNKKTGCNRCMGVPAFYLLLFDTCETHFALPTENKRVATVSTWRQTKGLAKIAMSESLEWAERIHC
jgi:hypothetical protein